MVSFDVVEHMAAEFRGLVGFERTSFSVSCGAGGDDTIVRALQCMELAWRASLRVCGSKSSAWFTDITAKLSRAGYRLTSKKAQEAWLVRPVNNPRERDAELRFMDRLGEEGVLERWPKRALIDGRLGRRRRVPREWSQHIAALRASRMKWDFCETSFARRGTVGESDGVLTAEVTARAFAAGPPAWSSFRLAAIVSLSRAAVLPRSIPARVRHRILLVLRRAQFEIVNEDAIEQFGLSGRRIVARKVVPSALAAASDAGATFIGLVGK
jgi:hypothetical protein